MYAESYRQLQEQSSGEMLYIRQILQQVGVTNLSHSFCSIRVQAYPNFLLLDVRTLRGNGSADLVTSSSSALRKIDPPQSRMLPSSYHKTSKMGTIRQLVMVSFTANWHLD